MNDQKDKQSQHDVRLAKLSSWRSKGAYPNNIKNTHCALTIIEKYSSYTKEQLSEDKIEVVNVFKEDVNLRWVDHCCYLVPIRHLLRINNHHPRISVTIDEDDGGVLFVY